MKTNWIIFIAFAGLLSSCGGAETTTGKEEAHHEESAETVELTEAQYASAEISLGTIEKRSISGVISVNGFLDVPPQSKVSVSAPMAGFVKSTQLLPGSKVAKGQVVAILENQDYIQLQQEYLENYGQLEYLNSEYERQKELAKENINARKSLEQAKANYLSAKGRIEGLRSRLELLNINVNRLQNGKIQNTINLYAPISGYVTKVNTNIGAFVNPTDVLIEIVNTAELHVELTVYEKDIPSIREGQRVLFSLTNETKEREARVKLIGREINSERSVQIHCDITKNDKELIPGMYLKAVVETDNALVSAVPESAIVYFEGKPYIFVREKEHREGGEKNVVFKMVEIVVGKEEAGFVAITLPEGFDVRKQLVVRGAFSLLAKMKNSEEEGGHAH
ncbi:efflux RND transporter periplasmic adaptor subunit [Fluviicola sp.]|uniref:efflux RND transporter periplasmic adaptor subunit n=1 Tax=Fluviicola sp. TaxID=1917219 RepID=UPI0031D32732